MLQALRSAPELAGLVRFNEFSQDVELVRTAPWGTRAEAIWGDDDDAQCQAWLQTRGVDVRVRGVVADCVVVVAKERTVHPVRDYLAALSGTGAGASPIGSPTTSMPRTRPPTSKPSGASSSYRPWRVRCCRAAKPTSR